MAAPGRDPAIDERLVARLWDAQHPFLLPLRTTAGEEIRVVYRGRRRFDRGPDFPGAIISLPGEVLVSGDVEIHVDSSDWRRHGHHRDRNYNGVILHVVLHNDTPEPCIRQDGKVVPAIELARHLLVPLAYLLSSEDDAPRPSPCWPGSTGSPELAALLDGCGMERFEAKVRRYEADLTCLHPDEILYRGIAGVLGYSQNREPFRSLVDLVPLERLVGYRRSRGSKRESESQNRPSLIAHHSLLAQDAAPRTQDTPGPGGGTRNLALEALLLGAAGLLPLQRGAAVGEGDPYAEWLDWIWSADGPAWVGSSMHAEVWTFFRVRPTNFPTRRVAALAFLVSRWPEDGLAPNLAALALSLHPKRLPRALESLLLGANPSGYWTAHSDFGQPLHRSADLVGRGRAAEAAVNLFLPFLAAWAETRGGTELANRAREAYRLYPKRSDNEFGRYVASQITGAARPAAARSACRQQGLLHIFRTWCETKRCAECPVAGRS